MSATAPSLPIPYVSVPVERFNIHNGPSRAWILRAMRELEMQAPALCYMLLTTGASSFQIQKRVEISSIEPIEGSDDEVSITLEVFGFCWSGRYNMYSREGWFGR